MNQESWKTAEVKNEARLREAKLMPASCFLSPASTELCEGSSYA
jgi:hypothetical protein